MGPTSELRGTMCREQGKWTYIYIYIEEKGHDKVLMHDRVLFQLIWTLTKNIFYGFIKIIHESYVGWY